MASRVRWGDTEDDGDGFEAPRRPEPAAKAEAPKVIDPNSLPPPQIHGPDKHGIKTIIEYKINADGLKVKVTRKMRMVRKLLRVSKAVQKRRQWKLFGEAKEKPADNDTLTMVSTEEIFLERTRLPSSKAEPDKSGDPLAALAGKNASLLVCRICGKKGDHWTSKCPYKDLAASKNMTIGEKPPGEDGELPSAGAKPGGYVPPSMRAGAGEKMAGGDSMRRRGDDNSIRVTNLSEDTREQDLQELFRPFGPVTRIYVAFDRETGEARGFAFINFVNRDDAQRAINALNGYGYDNLILRVEWSAPRPEKPS